jgi:hypothetical protein
MPACAELATVALTITIQAFTLLKMTRPRYHGCDA